MDKLILKIHTPFPAKKQLPAPISPFQLLISGWVKFLGLDDPTASEPGSFVLGKQEC